MPIHILIADDHPLIIEGIKNIFEAHINFNIIATVNNGKAALDFYQKNKVDVLLLDVEMPEMDGVETAKEILKFDKNAKIAMLSMLQEKSIIKNLIDIGVKGYLLKTIPNDELLLAVQNIYEGKAYFNTDITKALLSQENSTSIFQVNKSPLVDELTTREIEIIKLIAQGNTNTQIGEQLFISPRTVDTHRTNLMKKLDINNMASLIRFAFKNGLTN